MNGIFSGMNTAVLISAIIHAGIWGGLYLNFVKRESTPIVAELDLSMAPRAVAPSNLSGGRAFKPVRPWTLSQKNSAPTPAAAQNTTQAPMEESPNTSGKGSGEGEGNGQGTGVYVPVSQTTRGPRWVRNFIGSRDYPLIARQEGKDGLVVLSVLIDTEGRVKDVRLQQGCYPVLNEVAIKKVRTAIFIPAYGPDGRPVACEVTLPIRFKLQD
jgi:protein TonB